MRLPLPDRETVRTLLLDAGGVLVRPSFTRVAEALRARAVRADPVRLAAAEGLAKATLLLERLGLLDAFDAVVDSAIEGIEKPDPRLFLLALARLGAEPAGALHVGDLYHVDVVGARAAGLRAVLLDDADRYPEVDCPRVATLAELAGHLAPEAGAPILLNSEAAR